MTSLEIADEISRKLAEVWELWKTETDAAKI